MQTIGKLMLSLLIAAAGAGFTPAQTSINGSLRGRVTDSNAATVAGATVTLTNLTTNFKLTTHTDATGQYVFARVAPGDYSLAVEKEGFRRAVRNRLTINVNESALADQTLSIGALSETVNVEAGAAIVQSQNAEVSQLVNERRVKELPLNGKNFARLILLSPGVGGGDASNPAISGQRGSTNTYTVDGMNASDERSPGGIAIGGGAAITDFGGNGPNLVSTEAIQEFRIITTNADATFGRGSGTQVNIITKSGSNRFHGSAYDYLRNDALDAHDFFTVGKNPPFKQNLFGGTVGGPIIKDRHFFFSSYEGLRQKRLVTGSGVVPNATLIGLMPGDLRRFFQAFYLDRNLVPSTSGPNASFSPLGTADRTAAITAGFDSALFDGDAANGEAGSFLVTNAYTRDVRQDSLLVRTDHQLTDRLNASLRFGYARPEQTYSQFITSPNDIVKDPVRWVSGVAQMIYTLSPTQTLEARGGAQHSERPVGVIERGVDRSRLGLGSSPFGVGVTLTGTGIDGITVYPSPNAIDNQAVPQGSVLHTWTRGNLTLRSGLDLRYLMIDFANIHGGSSGYTFTGFVGQGSLLGTGPGQTQAIAGSANLVIFGTNSGPATPLRHFTSLNQEYFTQADWRIRRDLTLNLGLRYSYFGVYDERDGANSNLYAVDSSGNPVPDAHPFQFGRTANTIFPVTGDLPFYQPDRNNFQPRIGLAWDIGGHNRTVVRAAYGLYADRIYNYIFSGMTNNIPFASASGASFVPFTLGEPIPVSAGAPSITALDPALRNPLSHRFNVAIEQSVGRETSVTVAYVGGRDAGLIRLLEPNGSGAVPQSLRPDTRFSDQRLIANFSRSDYDSLQVQARRRFTRGVDFTIAYTFSRSRDDFSSDRAFSRIPSLLNLGADANAAGVQGGGAQFVERPRNADYGRSDFDVPHNLTFSHVIELPFGRGRRWLNGVNGVAEAILGGWSLNGIAVLRSGEPFTVTLGRDVNDDGDASTDRPMLLSGSLSDIRAQGDDRAQHLIPQVDANARLGVPAPIDDPFVAIARNALRGPAVKFYDVSLVKRFRLTERVALGFEANAFNLFNRAQLAAPIAALSNARFGRITSTRAGTNPRQLQFGLKLTF